MQTPINELAFNTIEWLDLCWFFFFHFCLLIKSVVGFAEVNLIDAVARALLKNDYFNSCASLSIRFKIETCSGVNNNTVAVIYNRRKRRRLSARHIIIENVRQIRVHRMTGIFQTNTTDVKSKRMSQLNNNHCQYIDIQYCLYLLSPFFLLVFLSCFGKSDTFSMFQYFWLASSVSHFPPVPPTQFHSNEVFGTLMIISQQMSRNDAGKTKHFAGKRSRRRKGVKERDVCVCVCSYGALFTRKIDENTLSRNTKS